GHRARERRYGLRETAQLEQAASEVVLDVERAPFQDLASGQRGAGPETRQEARGGGVVARFEKTDTAPHVAGERLELLDLVLGIRAGRGAAEESPRDVAQGGQALRRRRICGGRDR